MHARGDRGARSGGGARSAAEEATGTGTGGAAFLSPCELDQARAMHMYMGGAHQTWCG
jgi:hypothetical protein